MIFLCCMLCLRPILRKKYRKRVEKTLNKRITKYGVGFEPDKVPVKKKRKRAVMPVIVEARADGSGGELEG